VSAETYYSVLGVAETASQAEIKTAYKELIRQVHPDAIPKASPYWKQAAEEKTKEINEAYGVLSNVSKRRDYDRLLAEFRQGTPSQSPSSSAGQPPQQSAQQAQPAGPYCSICGTTLYASGYCPACQRFAASSANPPANPGRRIWPADTLLLIYFCLMAAWFGLAALRIIWVSLVCSIVLAGLLLWLKSSRVVSLRRRLTIIALVICAGFVIVDLAYPPDVNDQLQVAKSVGSSTVSKPTQTPPDLSAMPSKHPSHGFFSVDPMDGYGQTKTFMSTECSWNNVDPESRKRATDTGVLADHTFMISPTGETCYIWNRDVALFLAKGAVRGKPVLEGMRVVGYIRPRKQNSDEPTGKLISSKSLPDEAATVSSEKPTSSPEKPTSLSEPNPSSLSGLSSEEQRSSASRRLDLSRLDYDERQSIEAVCSSAKLLQGPAAYNRCLVRQLQSLSGYHQ